MARSVGLVIVVHIIMIKVFTQYEHTIDLPTSLPSVKYQVERWAFLTYNFIVASSILTVHVSEI